MPSTSVTPFVQSWPPATGVTLTISLSSLEAETVTRAKGIPEVLALFASAYLGPLGGALVAGLLFAARSEIARKNQGAGVQVDIKQSWGALGPMTSISIQSHPAPSRPRRSEEEAKSLVDALYRQLLERSNSADESAGWRTALRDQQMTVRQVVRGFVASGEFKSKYLDGRAPREGVKNLYLRLLARAPDEEGWTNWSNAVPSQGYSYVIDGFLNSAEYHERFGDDGVPG